MDSVNLLYYKHIGGNKYGNFGDELSPVVVNYVMDSHKYKLTQNLINQKQNLVAVGSYIHMAPNQSYIWGSGVRTHDNIERGKYPHDLNVSAVRGPLTRDFLNARGIMCPEIYGDPALLMPEIYHPTQVITLSNKIGVVPHITNYKYYLTLDPNKYCLINPTDSYMSVIDQIISCKYIISSSLHGLILSDAYNKPSVWLNEYPLAEGDFKFKDYFLSQNRCLDQIKIVSGSKADQIINLKYNSIDLTQLKNAFPFKSSFKS